MNKLEELGTEQTKKTFLRHGAKEPHLYLLGVRECCGWGGGGRWAQMNIAKTVERCRGYPVR